MKKKEASKADYLVNVVKADNFMDGYVHDIDAIVEINERDMYFLHLYGMGYPRFADVSVYGW